MSNVYSNPEIRQYDGDEPLYCHLGIHVFEFGRCLHCQHREVMLDLLLPKQSGPTTANG